MLNKWDNTNLIFDTVLVRGKELQIRSFGKVYEGVDLRTGEKVAIK